jgi:hypothetical protein
VRLAAWELPGPPQGKVCCGVLSGCSPRLAVVVAPTWELGIHLVPTVLPEEVELTPFCSVQGQRCWLGGIGELHRQTKKFLLTLFYVAGIMKGQEGKS